MAIEPGDGVTIEYVGRFEDGTVFDTSRYEVAAEHGLDEAQEADPEDYAALSFTVGAGEIITGLDEALVGMAEGEDTTVTVPPETPTAPSRTRRYASTTPRRSRGWSVRTRRSGCTSTLRTASTAMSSPSARTPSR
nr:FKBP-type peptidyl-prolyl cis-trans isomerase [Halapricum sp. CBA1109]